MTAMVEPLGLRDENRTLYRVITLVSSSLELDPMLHGIVDLATEATDCHACFIYLLEDGQLTIRAASPVYAAAVRAACAAIEAAEEVPSLAELAARAGYARHHFLRLFRSVAGVTPHEYAAALRARRLGAALASGERVADAVAGAGFGSESRVYEDGGRVLGMTPGAARRATG